MHSSSGPTNALTCDDMFGPSCQCFSCFLLAFFRPQKLRSSYGVLGSAPARALARRLAAAEHRELPAHVCEDLVQLGPATLTNRDVAMVRCAATACSPDPRATQTACAAAACVSAARCPVSPTQHQPPPSGNVERSRGFEISPVCTIHACCAALTTTWGQVSSPPGPHSTASSTLYSRSSASCFESCSCCSPCESSENDVRRASDRWLRQHLAGTPMVAMSRTHMLT